MTEEAKLERRKKKIKIANAIKCIMVVKNTNISILSIETKYTSAYISRVLSGQKAMSENFIKQLSIAFNLSVDNIEYIINYYLSLSDKLDDVTKHQLTILYILEYVLNLKKCFSNQVFKDYKDKKIDKFKN